MTDRAAPTDETLAQSRALFLEGVAHFEAGRLDEARTCFEKSDALTPGRLSVLRNLGVTLFQLNQWHAAIPVLLTTADIDPSLAEVWTCLGLAYDAQHEWQPAAEALEKSLALSPGQARLWLTLGHVYLRLAKAKDALRAFDRALEEDPSYAPAWTDRGSLMRELQRYEEAATSFERAIALGGDLELNGYYLASVRDGEAPTAPPRRYVEALFDDYAAEYQAHVVDTLGYQGFEALLQPLLESGKRYAQVLDLGCGTGLCGRLIAPHADAVDGVDVSDAMLGQARALGVYRELVHADLGEFLATTTSRYDLIVAADVFIYVGDIGGILRSARRVLNLGGCLAFTVEHTDRVPDIELMHSLRYAHSEGYLRRVANEARFTRVRIVEGPLRSDQAAPIAGLYVYME